MKKTTFLSLLILLLVSINVAGSQHNWKAEFDLNDASYNNGKGWSEHPDAAYLAWSESHFLAAYMAQYHSYGDIHYLDKVIEHFDRILVNMSDHDNDGFSGWQTSRYSKNESLNPLLSMHSDQDPTLPKNWVRWQSNPSTVFITQDIRQRSVDGLPQSQSGVVIKASPQLGWQALSQQIDYTENGKYNLSVDAKSVGSKGGTFYVYDFTSRNTLAKQVFKNSEWKTYSLDFVAPNKLGNDVRVMLSHEDYTAVDSQVYFEQVHIKQYLEYMVHDGLILTPIADFIYAVFRHTHLDSKFRVKANQYLTVLNTFYGKWEKDWDPEANVYTISSDKNGNPGYEAGTSLPHNQYLPFANMLLKLSLVTNEAKFLERATALVTTFKTQLFDNPNYKNAYAWHYASILTAADEQKRRCINSDSCWLYSFENTSYSSMDLAVVFEFFKYTNLFSGPDIRRFKDTFLEVMWNESENKVGVSVASNQVVQGFDDKLAGWVKLAAIDWNIREKIALAYRNITWSPGERMLVLAELANWDLSRVVNRGFTVKSAFDPTLPAHWQRWQSNSASVYRVMENNETRLVLKTASRDKGWQAAIQSIDYTPGCQYMFIYTARSNGVGARANIYDKRTGNTLMSKIIHSTVWESGSIGFTAPTEQDALLVLQLSHSDYRIENGLAEFKYVEIKPSKNCAQL